jgi:hypothetical protein
MSYFEQADTINDMWCSKFLNDDATVPSLEVVTQSATAQFTKLW